VLDIHLDFPLEVIVIFKTLLELKINQGAIVIVEAEELIFALLVCFQFTLKSNRIATVGNV
jgi:hypothetical protein